MDKPLLQPTDPEAERGSSGGASEKAPRQSGSSQADGIAEVKKTWRGGPRRVWVDGVR